MSFTVAPIVEGHGDVPAIRVLMQRMNPALQVARPVRMPRSRLIDPSQLIRASRIAAANVPDRGAILLLIDADEDCAKLLGAELEAHLQLAHPHLVCRAVLPVREFEAWIVGGDESYAVEDPDAAGNLKGRIQSACGVYKETVDQPKLIAKSDLDRLERCSRSFRRMKKVVAEFSQHASRS